MRHGGCVPAFGQHGYRDDASHVATWRNARIDRHEATLIIFQGFAVVLLYERRVLLRDLVAGPLGLTDALENEAQSPGFVILAATLCDVLGDLAVYSDRHFLPRTIPERHWSC